MIEILNTFPLIKAQAFIKLNYLKYEAFFLNINPYWKETFSVFLFFYFTSQSNY